MLDVMMSAATAAMCRAEHFRLFLLSLLHTADPSQPSVFGCYHFSLGWLPLDIISPKRVRLHALVYET